MCVGNAIRVPSVVAVRCIHTGAIDGDVVDVDVDEGMEMDDDDR